MLQGCLPEEILKEIYDFVKFMEFKGEKEMLTKVSQNLSSSSFQRTWDNEEDAIYDSL